MIVLRVICVWGQLLLTVGCGKVGKLIPPHEDGFPKDYPAETIAE